MASARRRNIREPMYRAGEQVIERVGSTDNRVRVASVRGSIITTTTGRQFDAYGMSIDDCGYASIRSLEYERVAPGKMVDLTGNLS